MRASMRSRRINILEVNQENQRTTRAIRAGYRELKAEITGELLTASMPTRLGLAELEYRRDGDMLRGKFTRNNRTTLVTLPRFGR